MKAKITFRDTQELSISYENVSEIEIDGVKYVPEQKAKPETFKRDDYVEYTDGFGQVCLCRFITKLDYQGINSNLVIGVSGNYAFKINDDEIRKAQHVPIELQYRDILRNLSDEVLEGMEYIATNADSKVYVHISEPYKGINDTFFDGDGGRQKLAGQVNLSRAGIDWKDSVRKISEVW